VRLGLEERGGRTHQFLVQVALKIAQKQPQFEACYDQFHLFGGVVFIFIFTYWVHGMY